MPHRFYIAPAQWNPESPRLEDEEAHHALHVLRLAPGDPVVIFNGQGSEQAARLGDPEGQSLPLVPGPLTQSPALTCRISLAPAIPKGKNMELIVQKSTELGAAAIHPVLSERTVVRLDRDEAQKKQAKWQRTAVEACKQSGQNHLPEVFTPTSMAEVLGGPARNYDLVIIASLQPGSRRLKPILAEYTEMNAHPPASVLILIGPEGDFTPAEVSQALADGAQPMTLGPIILRAETAAIYSLSVLAHELL